MITITDIKSIRNAVAGIKAVFRKQKKTLSKLIWIKIGALRRDLRERVDSYPNFKTEFGHLEGDTIVGEKHKSTVITLVEHSTKAIITLKTNGRKASDVEASINQWLSQVPSHLFKSITFDCGKEFSNWKSISNVHDFDIFFADPGCPGQRGLNEQSNGLLRRNGLPKQMEFTNISQNYESGTEIGNSLEFDFVVPPPHS